MRKLLVIFSLLMLIQSTAWADGIVVRKAEVRAADDGYQLSANFDIRLTLLVEQALTHGITLNFVSEFTLTRSRWYWFDEVTAKSEQVTKLSYNALTQQYRLKLGGIFQNFGSLDEALRVLGNQSSSPFPAELFSRSSGYVSALLKINPKYAAFTRMRLDISQLPKPLQVNALTSDEWKMDSEGYSWVLGAEELAQAAKNKGAP